MAVAIALSNNIIVRGWSSIAHGPLKSVHLSTKQRIIKSLYYSCFRVPPLQLWKCTLKIMNSRITPGVVHDYINLVVFVIYCSSDCQSVQYCDASNLLFVKEENVLRIDRVTTCIWVNLFLYKWNVVFKLRQHNQNK